MSQGVATGAMMAQMRKLSIDELKPGMRFNKPVYIDSNNILVDSNITIKESDIKKLITLGVHYVETAGELISTEADLKFEQKVSSQHGVDVRSIMRDYENLIKKRKDLIEVHRRACVEVERVHNAIKANEKFSIDGLSSVLNDIIKLLGESPNAFIFLYGLDEGKNYLVVHSVNVTFYSLIIGISLKYSPEKLRDLGLGTLLIDAGMLKIPPYIIHKQSNLTDQEFNLIKTHPLHGYRTIKQLGSVSERVAIVSLQHHESYDGRGYPRGLKGHQIDEAAKIAAIADSYEAQITNRTYRKRQYFYHAMKNLLSSGVNRFDPIILKVFLSRMSVYPIGSIVRLNDSSIGIVIGSVPQKPLRPILKLIFDQKGERIKEHRMVNLLEEISLYVVKALDEDEAGVSFLEVL